MPDPILPDLITIPAGRVTMGGYGTAWSVTERPAAEVHVEAFAIGRTPVTVAEFVVFMRATGAKPRRAWGGLTPPPGIEDHPVTNCSWRDASAYAEWLSCETGRSFCLPTEAQWERAARGDTVCCWPWGDVFAQRCANTSEADIGRTTPVTAHPDGASPFGVLDMAGNVWEWTRDLWKPYPYTPTLENPPLPVGSHEDSRRVLRGGSWMGDSGFARCASRVRWQPISIFSGQVGFRLACALS
jgi:toxoflavin biosynthesis protein ToxD